MFSVGNRLRRAREEQGLSLSRVADEIRIHARYLEAIEADDLSQLPGGFFTRSFVRQYADRLGVPMEEIAAGLEGWLAESASESAPSLEPRTMKFGVPPVTYMVEGRSRPRRKVLGAILALVVVIGGCAAVYSFWLQRQKEPPLAQLVQEPEAAPEPAVVETAPPTPLPMPEASGEVRADSAESAAAPESEPAVDSDDGKLRIEVEAVDEVWVRVKSGDETLYVGILNPGEMQRFSGLSLATLRIGNAGGLRVRVNGRDLGSLGPRGQIRILTITPGKTEVTAPERAPSLPVPIDEADSNDNGTINE